MTGRGLVLPAIYPSTCPTSTQGEHGEWTGVSQTNEPAQTKVEQDQSDLHKVRNKNKIKN